MCNTSEVLDIYSVIMVLTFQYLSNVLIDTVTI